MKPASRKRGIHRTSRFGWYILFLVVLSLGPYWFLMRTVEFAVVPAGIITAGYAIVWAGLYTVYKQNAAVPRGTARRQRVSEESGLSDLSGLNAEYRLFQNVRIPHTENAFDTVAVGPTGIWTLTETDEAGTITYDETDDALLVNGRPFGRDILAYTWKRAAKLKEFLRHETGIATVAQPVLVFPDEDVRMDFGFYPVRGVYVIRRGERLQLLTGYGRDALPERDRMKLSSVLRDL